jgi:hypothetical protein
VEANVEHWEGVITHVSQNHVVITFDAPAKGTGTVTFDAKTEFGDCAGDDVKDCTRDDLRVGRHLDTIGLLTSKRELRATKVLGIQAR